MAAADDVTREEFDSMKAAIERLGIQFEVLSRDNQYLHQRLADLSEAMNDRFDQLEARMDSRFEQVDSRFEQVNSRFEQVDSRFDRLEAQMNGGFAHLEKLITQSHATLLTLLQLEPH